MDGVKNLTQTPRRETGTSRVNDLTKKSRAATVRRIVQRFKPSKAFSRAQIDGIRCMIQALKCSKCCAHL